MSTYDDVLHLAKPAQGDTSWATEINQNWDALGEVTAPSYTYFVSPNFTSANLDNGSATDRRHFDTIQGAINEIETNSENTQYTILVYPGAYFENITITKSISIIGVKGASGWGYGTKIAGSTASAASVVTFSPEEDSYCYLRLANIDIYNQYNADNSSEILTGYAISTTAQTSAGAYTNRIELYNCNLRCTTWGDHNRWRSAIESIDGIFTFYIDGCQINTSGYGGGETDGWIRYVFNIEGDTAESSLSAIYCRNSSIEQTRYTTAPTGSEGVCNLTDCATSSRFLRCQVYSTCGDYTPNQNVSGLETSSADDYFNYLGMADAWM